MDKDYLVASAIIVVGLLSGLDHKIPHEDDLKCTLNSEWNTGILSIYQVSGVTILSNWPDKGHSVYISGGHVWANWK